MIDVVFQQKMKAKGKENMRFSSFEKMINRSSVKWK